jgi:hypothetical protein
MMLAAGFPSAIVRFCGRTISVPGTKPIVHFKLAPIATCIPISCNPFTDLVSKYHLNISLKQLSNILNQQPYNSFNLFLLA